jgi:hypothetical protein
MHSKYKTILAKEQQGKSFLRITYGSYYVQDTPDSIALS